MANISTPDVEGFSIPAAASGAPGDNCRDFRAKSLSATDSNEPESDRVESIDTYKYAPEWVPDRAFRVISAPQAKEKDPGTK